MYSRKLHIPVVLVRISTSANSVEMFQQSQPRSRRRLHCSLLSLNACAHCASDHEPQVVVLCPCTGRFRYADPKEVKSPIFAKLLF